MQLIDTHVGDLNAGLITVEFRGEGGEMVSVKMAANDDLDSDSAVDHAKALMVQLTTFADDRDPAQDEWERSKDEDDGGAGVEGLKLHLPAVSGFGDATSTPGSSV
ncbi:hypothetical protein [Pararhizobium sp. PWRC1-1]|uniref:hypothetical protein n=1 Tax=Pararhizobium sp. PWRC1-1 TaxID=2804566 RepID=UPI003CF420D5